MLNTTDICMLIVIIISFSLGWKNGLLRSLIGPISFVIFSIIGIIYFDLTQNLPMALIITSAGSIGLSFIITIALIFGRSTVKKDLRKYVFIGSRILGSIASVLWKGILALIIFLVIALLPSNDSKLSEIQADINQSETFRLANQYIISQAPPARNILLVLAVFQHPENFEEVASSQEFLDFFADETVQQVLLDEEILDQITNQKFAKLASNPRVRELIQNDTLMNKLTKLGKRIYIEKSAKEDSSKNTN